MKEVINPAYGRFEDFVRRVPRIFSEEGKTIYKARNEIKVFEVDGVELNVKRYRVPLLINRVIYRFFRQPKAVRAYEYALRLVAKGFETPAPIAYVLFREKGLLGYSYFISLQSSYKTLYKVGQRPVEENEDIFRALGTYMAELHEAEVYHADFSPGNVLYDRTIHFRERNRHDRPPPHATLPYKCLTHEKYPRSPLPDAVRLYTMSYSWIAN